MRMYFYEKPLEELTTEEWEKICMKCGKCCLCKYSDGDVIHFSNCICDFFDMKKGVCSCYEKRLETAKGECKKVDMELLETEISLLPPSCAYRCLYEGRPLPSYHPLITGDSQSVLKANEAVVSMPVYSEKERKEAIDCIVEQAIAEKWDKSKIRQEVYKKCQKYRLKWLETYPLVKK